MANPARQLPDPSRGPVVLCIMDGWGERSEVENNAVRLARTPVVDALREAWPNALLQPSGVDVGLPAGQVGNSEVGHMNIGAGRVVVQELAKINKRHADGKLGAHRELANLAKGPAGTGGRIHVMGLASAGGVHSHEDHLTAVARGLADTGTRVVVHAFTDGRDAPPREAARRLPRLVARLGDGVTLGTVTGRYFAMDRDKRWERTRAAFEAICHARSDSAPAQDAAEAVAAAAAQGQDDEFITPRIISGYDGMRDGDAIVMVNFRADRVRQLLDCWLYPDDVGFDARPPRLAEAIAMTSYSRKLDRKMKVLFPPTRLDDTLGQVVARAGRRQLRLAETEKYPHVTFFLNGGAEDELDGEERRMVPSPRVATYDLAPEMSASEVADVAVQSLKARAHDLIVMNFANPDMVGHTGVVEAAVRAVECVDGCVGRVADAVLAAGGQMILTADHGNCEVMWDGDADMPHTAHTTNPVPAIMVGAAPGTGFADGRLADLAPSLLVMMGLERPEAMTGRPLQFSQAQTEIK